MPAPYFNVRNSYNCKTVIYQNRVFKNLFYRRLIYCAKDSLYIIVSSPYTRALQIAAIISKNRQLNIKIELDLHEWMPDLSFQYSSKEQASKANRLCIEHKGI